MKKGMTDDGLEGRLRELVPGCRSSVVAVRNESYARMWALLRPHLHVITSRYRPRLDDHAIDSTGGEVMLDAVRYYDPSRGLFLALYGTILHRRCLTLCTNETLAKCDVRRHYTWTDLKPADWGDLQEVYGSPDPNLRRLAAEEEIARLFHRAWDTFTLRERLVFLFRLLYGYSLQQTAEQVEHVEMDAWRRGVRQGTIRGINPSASPPHNACTSKSADNAIARVREKLVAYAPDVPWNSFGLGAIHVSGTTWASPPPPPNAYDRELIISVVTSLRPMSAQTLRALWDDARREGPRPVRKNLRNKKRCVRRARGKGKK